MGEVHINLTLVRGVKYYSIIITDFQSAPAGSIQIGMWSTGADSGAQGVRSATDQGTCKVGKTAARVVSPKPRHRFYP
jgi:hypothetical protein